MVHRRVADPAVPRILFVTGRLAEFALRQVLDDLAPRAGFAAEVAVLPISVAALMPPKWVARHLEVPPGIDRVILPGHCRGDLAPVVEKAGDCRSSSAPRTCATCPATSARPTPGSRATARFDIEILAEINHAPRLDRAAILDAGRPVRAPRGPT